MCEVYPGGSICCVIAFCGRIELSTKEHMATRRHPNEQPGLSLGFSEQAYLDSIGRRLPHRPNTTAIILALTSVLFGCSRQEPPVQAVQPNAPSNATSPSVFSLAQFGGGACEVASLSGFHEAENWGAWTAKDPAEIVLKADLGGSVDVKFIAYTFDDGTSHDLKISIGNTTKTIALTSQPKTFDLNYSLSAPARSIILSGVAPRSPPTDKRLMGVGFVRVDCAAK